MSSVSRFCDTTLALLCNFIIIGVFIAMLSFSKLKADLDIRSERCIGGQLKGSGFCYACDSINAIFK